MKTILIAATLLFCAKTFAQDSGDELWKRVREKEAQGMDSLLGMKRNVAMPVLAKYNPIPLYGRKYPYIKEVLKIENFNKWQHLATLYIFIDSSENICKLNYFFNGNIPISDAKYFYDSMGWALPAIGYSHPIDTSGGIRHSICRFGEPAYDSGTMLGIDSTWVIPNYEDFYHRKIWRLFRQNNKSEVRAIYSVALFDHGEYAQKKSEVITDNIYEPNLKE